MTDKCGAQALIESLNVKRKLKVTLLEKLDIVEYLENWKIWI